MLSMFVSKLGIMFIYYLRLPHIFSSTLSSSSCSMTHYKLFVAGILEAYPALTGVLMMLPNVSH